MAKKQEFDEVKLIYKIVGIIALVLIIIGIIYALTRPSEDKKAVIEKPEIIENITIEQNITTEENVAVENVTNVTIEQNITNVTIEQNMTNITIEQNITNITENTTTTSGVVKYTWEGITIEFPETLKRLSAGDTTHHYITITETDGTLVTNGEQFDLKFILDQTYGSDVEIVPSFEGGKWLITLRLTNKGTYGLTVKIKCEDKKGYCQRLYPVGSTEKAHIFEVV